MPSIRSVPPPPGPEQAIVSRALTKRFGERTAVAEVDLSVPVGSTFGFIGPNGAGKTTLIRMLLGLTQPSSGSAMVLGCPMPAARARALRRVGAIVEEPRFHPHLSGRENLRLAAAARGPEAAAGIEPALRRVGLSDRGDDKVKGYSLGMRQRLGVARCLLADPLLLILDEPTNGLDPAGIQEFRQMVRTLVEEEGRTVFLSSHLLSEVERICDHVAIVDRGRVVVQGSLEELSGSGGETQLRIETDDHDRALALLSSSELVRKVEDSDDGLRVILCGPPDTAGAINAQLVNAGLSVRRLEPVHRSLEERFLQITSRLDAGLEEVAA